MKFKLIVDRSKDEEIIACVHAESNLTREIENLVLSYVENDKLLVMGEDEMEYISFSSIECITIIDRKVYAIDHKNKRFRVKSKLFELEEILPSYFVRINKSSLANMRAIKRFKSAFNGSVDVEFNCGYVDYVSRRCLGEVKRRFLG